MTGRNHKSRTADEIISINIYHDALGFGYRAASWMDLTKRTGDFAALHYACIDARLAIENLMFEQLVITGGKDFTPEAYKQCLAKPRELKKMIWKIVPDYNELQEFTGICLSMNPGFPPVNRWDIKGLLKSWGTLSSYLHWSGAHDETTENQSWQDQTVQKVAGIVEPLWQKMISGHSGCLRPEDMIPSVRQIWDDFRRGKINKKSVRTRLEIVRPMRLVIPSQPDRRGG